MNAFRGYQLGRDMEQNAMRCSSLESRVSSLENENRVLRESLKRGEAMLEDWRADYRRNLNEDRTAFRALSERVKS